MKYIFTPRMQSNESMKGRLNECGRTHENQKRRIEFNAIIYAKELQKIT